MNGSWAAAALVFTASTLGCESDRGGPAESADSAIRTDLSERQNLRGVSVRDSLTLSFAGMPRAPDSYARAHHLGSGRWGVTSGTFPGIVQLFDSAGQPAATLGRQGSGPGEFGGAVEITTAGEHVWISDPGNSRLYRYAPDLSSFVSRPLPGLVAEMAPRTGGDGVLLSGSFPGQEVMRPVAAVSMHPEQDRFGGEIPSDGAPGRQHKVAVETGTGETWTVSLQGGAVSILRTSDLEIIEERQIPGEEFSHELAGRSPGSEPPVPELSGLTTDRRGNVWIHMGRMEEGWTPELHTEASLNDLVDTWILVVDPGDRAVIAEGLLDEVCFPVVQTLVSCVDEMRERIRIRRLELRWNE